MDSKMRKQDLGRRGQPLQVREPMPGAEDVESRPKIGRRGQPPQDREALPVAKDVEEAGTVVSSTK